jgi:hypothetical protein
MSCRWQIRSVGDFGARILAGSTVLSVQCHTTNVDDCLLLCDSAGVLCLAGRILEVNVVYDVMSD